MRILATLTAFLLLCSLGWAQGGDRDRDGIRDEVELQLGMDPESPDVMHFVHDDMSIPDGDTTLGRHKLAPDVTKVYFGNVAQDRWFFRVDFAEEFVVANTLVIFYLDVDNNLTTGRQGGPQGTDVMLLCTNGGFGASIRNARVTGVDRRTRGAIDGKSVYFSMDLDVHHNADGNAEMRGMILVQHPPQDPDSDHTEWFAMVGKGAQDKPKPRAVVASEFRSTNVYVEQPWLGWREDLRKMKAITLDSSSAELTGMTRADRALVPEAENARAKLPSPASGKYHLGIVLRDSGVGNEELEVKVRGELVARCVAAQNNGALALFVTKESVDLAKGDAIELIAAGPAQDFYVSEVLLLPQPPHPRPLEITHVETYCPPQRGDTVDVDVCFLTDQPCRGWIKWGEGKSLGETAEGEHATYNHRVHLTGLRRGRTYSVQACAGRQSAPVKSEVVGFVAEQKRIAKSSVRRERVELNILDAIRTPPPRPAWPVDGGVPIPVGALSSADKCRLLDANGDPVPAQFTELAWWPDGGVKWVLVSLVHPGGKGKYVLEYGEDVSAPAPPADGIRVDETDDGLRVTNGRLRVDLSRTRFARPGEMRFDSNGNGDFEDKERVIGSNGPGFVLTDAEGKRYTSTGQPLRKLEVEESGPVRTVVLAEGRFAGQAGALFSFRCRLYFYRGFTGVPTIFTLIADEGESVFPPTMTPITSLTLPVTGEANLQSPPLRLLQDDDNHLLVTRGSQTVEQKGRGLGFSALTSLDSTLTVCLRDFWQLYPKAIGSEGSTLRVEIFPELPTGHYAKHTDPKLLTQHYYWQRDGKYLIPAGTAPSCDLLFFTGDATDSSIAAMAGPSWNSPIVLSPTPEHYCASGALGDLLPEKPNVFDTFQQYVDNGYDRVEASRERLREYSWMNYGDWYGERGVNWGNQEYDFQWGLLVQFARSGDLRYFDRAIQAAKHTVGIDSVNWSPQPNRLGIQKYHCLGHTGGHEIPRVEGAKCWFTNGGYNTGHMWTQGTYTAYCLTGDRRYLDTVDLTANWLAEWYTQNLEQWVHRNYGWSTIAVLGGYHVTANPYYLNAARLFCDYMIARQDPGTGVWAHPIGECSHAPRHMGGKVFMSGVDMTGLRMLDAIEPRDDLKNAIVRNCDWMYHRMWHPQDNSFQYAQCTNFDKSSTHAGTYMACEGLAYAYELTKKPEFKEMLLRSLGDTLSKPPSSNGKGYAMQIRMTPFALALMERWGIKEVPLPPPAAR